MFFVKLASPGLQIFLHTGYCKGFFSSEKDRVLVSNLFKFVHRTDDHSLSLKLGR